MKKLYILLASLLAVAGISAPAAAQTEEEAPNRILVIDKAQYFAGYNIPYIEGIQFAHVDGEVMAPIEFLGISDDLSSISCSLKMTPACKYYRISLAMELQAQRWNDISFIRYTENTGTLPDTEAFDYAEIQGLNLKRGTSYYLISVAYDEYDTAVGVSKAYFTTPDVEVVGNPHVDIQVVNVTLDSFTLSFTPNKDVLYYYYMAFEENTWQEYLAMWGPSFGCSTISELIAFWWQYKGVVGPATVTWDPSMDIFPGETYDVIVAAADINGNFAPHQMITVSTQSQGGTGEAFVEIEAVDYTAEIWGNEILPSLWVTFWPNDETARYRYRLYYDYEWERYGQLLVEELMQDPPQPGITDWWTYDPVINEYQLMPSTTVYGISVAQNSLHEWGTPNVVEITTPDECEGYNPAAYKISPVDPDVVRNMMSRGGMNLQNAKRGVMAPRPEQMKKIVVTQKTAK